MESRTSLPNGVANAANIPNHQNQTTQPLPHPLPQPLHSVAQQAYDRYGVLDPIKLDLMIRGIFITREYAATLPSRITSDGYPELNPVHASHHSRPPRVSSGHHPRAAAGGGVVKGPRRRAVGGGGDGAGAGRARKQERERQPEREVVLTRELSAAVTVSSSSSPSGRSSGGTDISAVPSDHEKWGEEEVEMIIRMRAERVGFRYIAERFPSKNQKAVQEKFYKSIKDPRDPRWKQLYHQLRAGHDRQVKALNNNNNNDNDTLDDPVEINSDEGTIKQPIDISSGSGNISEATTVTDPDPKQDQMVDDFDENALGGVKMAA
ncbi:hypothetical protein DHEL01_v202115 [Diaporthe helianthi]|uniref:Myb-like domain-containing protein n=1 Tax=Diaporthe helianthi TaxID=158607 RepID=A0A2P5IAG9_DIAHE|nr:hypothetical protein DHEL01_v202115 [Diaporthe helianthi]